MKSRNRPFSLALALSLCLHAAVLASGLVAVAPQGAPSRHRIEASIQPPPSPALLKNTMDEEESKPRTKLANRTEPRPPPEHRDAASRPKAKAAAPLHPFEREPTKLHEEQLRRAQRALAGALLYPEEAVDQGLEGEVVLLLALDGEGRILRAEVASSSGHGILDRAALRAVGRIGRLPGLQGVQEFLLPVRFQLS